MSNAAHASIPCPDCGTRIEITLEALLNGQTLVCPQCNAHLSIAAGAREPKDRLAQTLTEIEAIKAKLPAQIKTGKGDS